jgi:hypothetical protein
MLLGRGSDRDDFGAWFGYRAPLWVVFYLCALLSLPSREHVSTVFDLPQTVPAGTLCHFTPTSLRPTLGSEQSDMNQARFERGLADLAAGSTFVDSGYCGIGDAEAVRVAEGVKASRDAQDTRAGL